MSHKIRKIAAASVAVVCAASMCGCSDTGYIGTINGIQIPTGMYIYNIAFPGYDEAYGKIEEEMSADTEAEITVFTENIEGKPASQWLKDYALESLKRYVAVETLFDEYELSLSEEDKQAINDYISTLDDDLGYYAMYYGIEESTFGEHYENMGIGKSSLRSLSENGYKENYVFMHVYGADGLTPVTDDEINSYITENYAAVKLLKLDFTDYQGISLKDEKDIQAVKDLAQSYADRFNAGESWVDIQYDYDLRQAQFDAWLDAEDKFAEEHSETSEESASEEEVTSDTSSEAESETSETTTSDASAAEDSETTESGAEESTSEEALPTESAEEAPAQTASTKPVVSTDNAEYDAYVQAAIDAATAEKKESADECDQFIGKESSSLDEDLTEYIWNTAADGKATIFTDDESGNSIYVVVREDVTTKDKWKESQNESLLHLMKEDAFEELLKSTYESYSVEMDSYLVDTKYAPEKLKGIGK
ncbi:MAG: hypothetical protein J6A19_01350 [Oscillospiraceae bacterium]|nr:hypothetical protein [Oscillospiraceae bacterium]